MGAWQGIVRIAGLIALTAWLMNCDSSARQAEREYQAGLRLKARGDVAQALPRFRNATRLNPQHVAAQTEAGILLCRERRYAAALDFLRRAIAHNTADYRPYAYAGFAYTRLRRLDFAEDAYRRALRREPRLSDVRRQLADVLEAQGKRAAAADVLERLLTQNLDDDRADALKLRIALLRQPESQGLHRALADVYLTDGEIRKGTAEYRAGNLLDPAQPETIAQFGMFCAERGQFAVAATYLQQALQAGLSNEGEARLWLGAAYEASGRVPEAIAEYQRALRFMPDLYVVFLKVAELLERNAQDADAAMVLERLFHLPEYRQFAAQHEEFPGSNRLWREILRLRGESDRKAVVWLNRAGAYDLIDVTVNHDVPARVLVDASAEYTMISEQLAPQLRLAVTPSTSEIAFEFMGQTYKAPVVNLEAVRVGELTVYNVPALIWDFANYPGIDGLLGATFLKHFQVDIEFKEQLVVLTRRYS